MKPAQQNCRFKKECKSLFIVLITIAARENQFPNRVCQRGALQCETVPWDAVTAGLVSDLFTSSRSSGPRLLSSGVRTKKGGKCKSSDNGVTN